jgi:hypothetical protein
MTHTTDGYSLYIIFDKAIEAGLFWLYEADDLPVRVENTPRRRCLPGILCRFGLSVFWQQRKILGLVVSSSSLQDRVRMTGITSGVRALHQFADTGIALCIICKEPSAWRTNIDRSGQCPGCICVRYCSKKPFVECSRDGIHKSACSVLLSALSYPPWLSVPVDGAVVVRLKRVCIAEPSSAGKTPRVSVPLW